jgi:hypothetical protein
VAALVIMRKRVSTFLLRLSIAIAVAAALLFHASSAHAYPWMIRYEYTQCVACHADPSGGGLLTEYGRVEGEYLLRTRYPQYDNPGRTAGFLGFVPLPSALLLGGDVREAALWVKPQGAPATTDIFMMQADAEGQVKVGRVRANGSIGFAQEGAFPASITKGSSNNLVSRLHWVGVDLGDDDQFTIRAGRMNLPFGNRSIDHVSWTRTYTRTDTNQDQDEGLAFAFNLRHFRGEVMAIAGNYQEAPDAFRERGYSAFVEVDPLPKLAFGASSLVAHSNIGLDPNGVPLPSDLWRQAHGVFARYSPFKPLVLMGEYDFLYDSQPATLTSGAINAPGFVGQFSADLEVIQGVHLQGIAELLDKKSDLPGPGGTQPWLRGWGVLNWFFLPHADLRFDLIYESDAQSGERIGITTFLGQVHAYL